MEPKTHHVYIELFMTLRGDEFNIFMYLLSAL